MFGCGGGKGKAAGGGTAEAVAFCREGWVQHTACTIPMVEKRICAGDASASGRIEAHNKPERYRLMAAWAKPVHGCARGRSGRGRRGGTFGSLG